MECRDEQERFDNGNLSHDVPATTPDQFAIQALVDHLQQKEQTDE